MNISKRMAVILFAGLTNVSFVLPVLAAPGDIYEADFGSGSIKRISPTGTVSVFVSGLSQPSGLAFDSSGNLFVAELGNGTIVKITPDGSRSNFATGLTQPFGLAFDSAGNLYEGDRSGQIFKFTPAGTRSTFATGLNIPAGLAFDFSGKLFETDFGSGQVFTFKPAKTLFAAGLVSPNGLVFTSKGDLLVNDSGAGKVYQFTPAGVKTTLASGLGQPTGLVFDAAGNLFVSDNQAGAIFKIAPDGTKTTFATGFVNPQNLAIQKSTGAPVNISTRAQVLQGDGVLIGGFIIQGSGPKKVLLRGIGPSLGDAGIVGFLSDPTLELHRPDGSIITNDNWKDTQEAAIMATTIPPTNDLESALLVTLAPGAYTAILAGAAGSEGVGLVEIYDLDGTAIGQLANISTRGSIQTGEDVMIGGLIVVGNSTVIIRGLGPSLADEDVRGVLMDPVVDLHGANGELLASNDNWQDGGDAGEIADHGLAPPNDKESALLASLPSGAYTAVESGVNKGTGLGLIEIYNLN